MSEEPPLLPKDGYRRHPLVIGRARIVIITACAIALDAFWVAGCDRDARGGGMKHFNSKENNINWSINTD